MDLTPVEIVRCVVLYYYNERPLKQFEAACGTPPYDRHPDYLDEKMKHYLAGFCEWFNRFDRARQDRWVAAAITKYSWDVLQERALLTRAETNDRAESAEGQR